MILRGVFRTVPSGVRAVNRGESMRNVSAPASTASEIRLRYDTRSRAVSEVIHLESPFAAAIFPSSVSAIFSSTKGRPSVIHLKKAS